ncbi:conserved hypothetical protein [Ricinus communis]|uniref:MATH domain-containing protein n=1 Tax=Ricinus communis TaxID=3988 RepID=B9RP22_RICCO|nr:conserved hypothetical protein [Ricinus communis]
MKHTSSEAVPSSPAPPPSATSATSLTDQSPPATSSSSSTISPEDLAVGSTRDGSNGAQEMVTVDRKGEYAAVCKWTVNNFPRIKARALWSKYFEVGGYDCRLLIYPKGDSQALPGYISIYLQIMDPRGTSSSKWDCFASYRLSIVNLIDDSKTIHRDSWHRFSSKKKSHGWCDFTPSNTIFDSKLGYLFNSNNDSVLITADIFILNESVSFIRDNSNNNNSNNSNNSNNNNELQSASSNVSSMISSSVVAGPVSDVLSGKFTWKVHNFSLFKEMIKTQKIMSPVFPAGECNLRISVYQSSVNGHDYLSMCLESKDTEKTVVSDRSCWCLFRMSLLNQKPGSNHMHRDSYGRFAADNKTGDNTSLGWNDYMKMCDFVGADSGFLVDDTAVFSTSFHVIKEFSSFSKNGGLIGGRSGSGARKSDGHMGKFTWRIENFTRLKDLLKKRKITGLCIKSRRFQIGNRDCRLIVYPRGGGMHMYFLLTVYHFIPLPEIIELKMTLGVYESFDTICIYLESDQSVGSDLDKNFWVRYRMAVVNQKNPAKTVWKESSICTKTWNNSVLQFMKVSDMLEADAGFLVRDTVVFVCEILDCCPWFEFSDLEVLASEDDQDALTTDPDELIDSEDSEGISGDEEDIFRNLLSRAGFHLTYGDNPSQPQVTLREKLLMDAGAIAGFLTGLRVYLDDPAKVKRLLLPTKLSGNNDGKKGAKADESSPSLMNLLMGVKVLQQAIIDLLLDIMVECCQPSEGSCNDDSSDVNSKPSVDGSGAASPLESDRESGATESAQFPVYERLDSSVDDTTSASAVQSSDANGIDVHGKALPGQPTYPPITVAGGSLENASLRSKTKWPEQSEELLGLIVNSLRALDGAVPQGCPEPRRRPQSAQKIALVLDKAPKHLQPDLVALVPKLVEHSEHPLAACALLERLQKPDAEPALRMPVFGALSQLECGSDVWERLLYQSFELLADSNDEPLAATIDFIFKAASQCQHLPEAVRSVRVRLKHLGAEVSPCVMDFLSKTVNSWGDVAETILRDIECDDDFGDDSSAVPCGLFLFGENGPTPERLHVVNEQAFHAACHFSDIYILIEMLSIPCLAVEASQTFERAVARGVIVAQSVAMVLERRLAQRLNFNARYVAENFQHGDGVIEGEASEQLRIPRDDFNVVLGLAETLALSRDPCVKGFVKMLYTILFKWYADESYRGRMVKRLVDHATSATDNSRDVDLDLDILVILVCEEQEIVKPVLSMMREVAELANVDRAALWHQLCANEDEIIHMREERKAEISSMVREKAVLSQKLAESEATNNRLKSEMRAEMDRSVREKKELAEQMQEVESQLEWLRSERDDEIAKLTAEKKVLQDRLHDAETQLSQLKSRKRDELKRVVKEKNALAERLKGAEAARRRFDEELKRYATENVTRDEIRQSLEDEVRRLTQTVGQTEGEKREKEEQVARCEAYIDGMESKLQTCQQYIHTLETSLQEEMSRHAPLYGAGLEALSMKELETISRIHEEGLRQIHALQQRKGSPVASPLVSPHTLPHSHGLYPAAPPPMAVGLPPSLIPNGVGIHSNGHVNGAVGPWFNHT